MNKTVDLNERALEKERAAFIHFCNLCGGFCGILLVFMMCGLIVYGYDLMVSAITGGAIEDVISSAANLVTCIGTGISAWFGMKVFSRLNKGGTPFRYDVADKIKGAAAPLTACGGIGFLIEVAVIVMTTWFGYSADKFDFFGGLDILVFGLVLNALSYIFNYGCKLQQESDETI